MVDRRSRHEKKKKNEKRIIKATKIFYNIRSVRPSRRGRVRRVKGPSPRQDSSELGASTFSCQDGESSRWRTGQERGRGVRKKNLGEECQGAGMKNLSRSAATTAGAQVHGLTSVRVSSVPLLTVCYQERSPCFPQERRRGGRSTRRRRPKRVEERPMEIKSDIRRKGKRVRRNIDG